MQQKHINNQSIIVHL